MKLVEFFRTLPLVEEWINSESNRAVESDTEKADDIKLINIFDKRAAPIQKINKGK